VEPYQKERRCKDIYLIWYNTQRPHEALIANHLDCLLEAFPEPQMYGVDAKIDKSKRGC